MSAALYSSALHLRQLVHLNKDNIDFGHIEISIHGKWNYNRKIPVARKVGEVEIIFLVSVNEKNKL